ncbi:MAG: hypothetical protein ACFFDE_08105 [Promethearchaeota archaeon]
MKPPSGGAASLRRARGPARPSALSIAATARSLSGSGGVGRIAGGLAASPGALRRTTVSGLSSFAIRAASWITLRSSSGSRNQRRGSSDGFTSIGGAPTIPARPLSS